MTVIAGDRVTFEEDVQMAMPARRSVAARILRALTSPARRLTGWWNGLLPAERLMWRGLVLLSSGLALVAIPLALIVPGAILTAAAFGFTLSRGKRDGDG